MFKKLLAFVVLFGGGLAALYWLDQDRGQLQPRGANSGSASTEHEPRSDSWAAIGGEFRMSSFGEATKGQARSVWNIVAKAGDQGPDGRFRLEDIELDLFDRNHKGADQRLLARVEATGGWVDLPRDPETMQPTLGSEIELHGVTVGLVSGSRLVPLTLSSERLDCNIDEVRFWTEAYARIEGTGLLAEGTGMRLDEALGRIEFNSDAKVVVRPGPNERGEAVQPGRISCAGSLVIEQLAAETGPNPLLIRAHRRALLAVESNDSLSVEAEDIDVHGTIEQDGSAFAFSKLVADREVTLRAKRHRFECKRATFNLGPGGDLVSASLEGSPDGTLALEQEGLADPTLADEVDLGPGDSRAKIWGKGPMNLTWTPEAAFQIAGPATLSWRDAELSAAGGIYGSPQSEEGGTPFTAFNAVRFDIGGWRLETDQISGQAQGASIDLETTGQTSISGTTTDGSALDLVARDGFEFEYDSGRWVIPRAASVDLMLDGARKLSASAASLLDFDPEEPAFTAVGDVALHQDLDELHGQRLTVRGESFLELEGADGIPVEYETVAGRVVARQIKRVGDRLEAAGAVTADMAFEDFEIDLTADRMTIVGAVVENLEDGAQGAPTTEPDPDATPGRVGAIELKGPLVLEAEGSVHAVLDSATEAYDVSAETLRLERESLELLGLEGRRRYRTALAATGGVNGTLEGALGRYRIEADELDGRFVDPFETTEDARDPALVDASAGSLDARGNVIVDKLDEPLLSGRGDVFHVSDDRTGRLQSTLPDRPVRASGELPSSGAPFQLRASQVEFGPDFLAGRKIELVVVDRGTPSTDRGRFALSELLASASRFEASESQVEFLGDVSFTGKTGDEHTWNLRAALVRFDNSLGDRATKTGLFDRMIAEKDVAIDFSDGPEATGDYLTADAWSGRVRITGSPARLWSDTAYESDRFEVNTRQDYLMSMGAGVGNLGGSRGERRDSERDGRDQR